MKFNVNKLILISLAFNVLLNSNNKFEIYN